MNEWIGRSRDYGEPVFDPEYYAKLKEDERIEKEKIEGIYKTLDNLLEDLEKRQRTGADKNTVSKWYNLLNSVRPNICLH